MHKGLFLLLLLTIVSAVPVSAGWNNGEWREVVTASSQNASVTARIISTDASQTACNYSKAVVICEGFDASDGTDEEFTLDRTEECLTIMSDGNRSVYQNLLADKYTMVLVDFDDNWEDLKRQGYALGNLLQEIWNRSPKKEPIKVMGMSMGGIIGSFACRIKEFYSLNPTYPKESWEPGIYSTWSFSVNLMLTVDSPHSGAHIPLSIWSFCDFFGAAPGGEQAKHNWNAMMSTAATQMLITRFSGIDQSSWKNLYKAVINTFKATKSCRFAGIVCGSWTGAPQFTNNSGQLVIDWTMDDGCKHARAKLWSELEAVTTRQTISTAHRDYCHTFNFDFSQPLTIPNEKLIIENSAGGWAHSYQDIVDGMPASKPTPLFASHCFIPTYSAAALDFDTYAPLNMRNLGSLEQQRGKEMEEFSSMHKIYHQDNNLEHVFGMTQDQIRCAIAEIKSQTHMNSVALQMINALF